MYPTQVKLNLIKTCNLKFCWIKNSLYSRHINLFLKTWNISVNPYSLSLIVCICFGEARSQAWLRYFSCDPPLQATRSWQFVSLGLCCAFKWEPDLLTRAWRKLLNSVASEQRKRICSAAHDSTRKYYHLAFPALYCGTHRENFFRENGLELKYFFTLVSASCILVFGSVCSFAYLSHKLERIRFLNCIHCWLDKNDQIFKIYFL